MTVIGTIRTAEGRLFIERDDGISPDVFLHVTIAKKGDLAPPYDGRRVRCEVALDGMGNCAARSVTELLPNSHRRNRDEAAVDQARPIVTGTVRIEDARLFIVRDDGQQPDIFLHPSIAERGGLAPPYDGQKVRCEVTWDAMGNCAAVKVSPAKHIWPNRRRVGSPPDAA
jgi:cold shock CspA family protein